ncbi:MULTISPECIES: S8 family serine peptidase [unclassified Mesobacillus]|uniref:S8 family serine peptidase n=1 Tax=unclassified Mesobacillus TaxID=2675270 RepID=UPI00204225A4|nr:MULTISPECIES: S8 family serine peptidase [unclassified Mesobacillus]MCM3124184.1 S8 family serine peptidase [Mesobacillus sp. MER 33]MCM3234033.1 S8 family serine peptidase [Mesobacillus sp. MER 48]
MMRFRGAFFAILFFFVFVSVGSAEEDKINPRISKFNTAALFDKKKEFESRELIIKFNSNITSEEKQKILQSVNVKELSNLKLGNLTLVSTDTEDELTTIAKNLLRYKQVEYVEPNYKLGATFTPGDPGYSKQWYLNKIQIPKAWDISRGASNVTVAVIDGGVQTSHPDLKGKMVSPIDITTGRSTITGEPHGTHVAGIIAATINKTGIAGIAPNVKIMPVNVFKGETANVDDVVKGIKYAVDHNADILNLSLGSRSYSYALEHAVKYASSKGVMVIAAAGNERTYISTYPAAIPSVLAVSATDKNDKITGFSNYGSYIDIAAPGLDIFSTISGSSYTNMSGTSMASPVVSGVSALILSKNPLLKPAQVESIIKKTAYDLGSKGWDSFYGHGRVDAYKALSVTPYPVHSLTLSTRSFTMKGTNKNNVSFYAQSGITASLYIQNSKGTIIKKLITNKKWAGGKLTAAWDGKMDNGDYAISGTYKIVAKATNGKKTVYKSTTMKVIDKVTTSIQAVSSVQFSPALKSKLSIPYYLTKNARATAVIYDSKHREVKRLLNKTALKPGKKTLVWNGKNNKGKKVSNGKYTLVMSAYDSKNVKRASKKITVIVDSVMPKGNLTIISSLFKMDGRVKPGVKVNFNERVYVRTYVTTDKGVKVRKLTYDKVFTPGASTLSWDGKNDKGLFVAEGKYRYYIEYRDAAGNKKTMKSSIFSVQDWVKPAIKSTAPITYRSTTNLPVSYTTSKPGYVKIELLKDNKVFRTILTSTYKAKGSYSFVFNGKDQTGNYLADGKYQFRITITDKYKLTTLYNGYITVALTKVVINYPSVVQYFPGDEAAVYYSLSEKANVTIEIFNELNQKVKTIIANTPKLQGINSFVWDGSFDGNFPEVSDIYYYTIKAKNTAGNEAAVKGKMTLDEDPFWLKSKSFSFIASEGSGIINNLVLDISVTQQIKMTLIVFDSSYNFLDEKEFELINGVNKLEYYLPTSADRNYIIEFKDLLGNLYYYSVQE